MTDEAQSSEQQAQSRTESDAATEAPSAAPVTMPDYLLEPNAVLLDKCEWRHNQVVLVAMPLLCLNSVSKAYTCS